MGFPRTAWRGAENRIRLRLGRWAAPLSGALSASLLFTALAPVPAAAGDAAPAEYLVAVEGDAVDFRSTVTAAGGVVEDVFGRLDMLAVTMPPAAAEALDRRSDIEVDRNFTVHALDTRVDPPSYGLDRIDQRSLPLSGTYGVPADADGTGVSVYILDSGIRADHTEFRGRVAGGFGAVADGRGTSDCNGHGTHVAGTVAGDTVGVAPGATLVPVRILDCTGRTSSGWEFMDGMNWILTHHRAGTPAVLNMSIGAGASSFVDSAVADAVADGIVVVAAAGNSATDACTASPARAASAITVAATSINDRRASYSNHGRCVDIFAPGGDGSTGIRSAYSTGSAAYASLAGTSMATPHVAGVAARYLSAHPSATPAQVTTALLDSATTGAVTSAGTGSPNRLLYADPAGFGGASPEAPSEEPAAAEPPKTLDTTPTPKITGTSRANYRLTAKAGTWGPAPVTLRYQWNLSGRPIPGATASSYRVAVADAGRTLTVTVTGSKDGYSTVSKTSAPQSVAKIFTRKPTPKISGTSKIGAKLRAVAGTWGPGSVKLRYQWHRSGKPIRGADASWYRVTAADAGKRITVTVTGSKKGYGTVSKTSAPKSVPKRR